MTAPEAFEKWWQALPLRNGEITADHIRQAWDAGVLFERERCARINDAAAAQCKSFHASNLIIKAADDIRAAE